MRIRILCFTLVSLALTACVNDNDAGSVPNAPPNIGAIVDQSISANIASMPIAFTVNDENPAALSISITSDNPVVVADDDIALSGAGASRSLIITPVADALGDAFITLVATDTAGLSSSTSFLLSIEPLQESLQQFTRATFLDPAAGEPALVNALEFAADADNDDFADLLAQ